MPSAQRYPIREWRVENQNILMKIIKFLRPNFYKLFLLFILMTMTLFVIVNREATSKISWDQVRGTPFPSLVLTEYRGPCPPQNIFCVEIYFQRIYPIGMFLDILIWYVVSCIVILPYEMLKRQPRA